LLSEGFRGRKLLEIFGEHGMQILKLFLKLDNEIVSLERSLFEILPLEVNDEQLLLRDVGE